MNQSQSKKEAKTTGMSSLARMMATREKEKRNSQKANTDPDLRKKARSKEYVSLLQKLGDISVELSDLETEIEELENTLRNEEKNVVEEVPSWLTETAEQPSRISDAFFVPRQKLQSLEERQSKLLLLKQKREELVEELRTTYESFLQAMPAAEQILGMVYPLCNTDILLKYGMIKCIGRGYHSQEELIQQVKPSSEKVKQQWIKGDNAYEAYYSNDMLCVEIYMEEVCVIWMDGEVTVVE